MCIGLRKDGLPNAAMGNDTSSSQRHALHHWKESKAQKSFLPKLQSLLLLFVKKHKLKFATPRMGCEVYVGRPAGAQAEGRNSKVGALKDDWFQSKFGACVMLYCFTMLAI